MQPNHIVCRGNNRRRLFSFPRDYLSYLRLLSAALERHECLLHGLCLMTNHVHLLLTPPTIEATSKAMQQVNQRYAQLHNHKRKGSGKLFEQSFESDPVESERHLAFCVLYIDANPHSAAMRNRNRYPWSTHAMHLGRPGAARIPPSMIVHDAWYHGLGSCPTERAEAYERCFQEYRASGGDPEFRARAERMEPPETGESRLERPDRSSAA